jgi:RNA polymerase-associated protein LEO1
MSDSEDQVDIVDDGGDDLFGGDDGDDAASQSQASERNARVLSDRDLASEHGDGYDEDDRLQNDEDEDAPVRHINVEKVAMFRHRIPKSKDNQVSLPIPAHNIGAN